MMSEDQRLKYHITLVNPRWLKTEIRTDSDIERKLKSEQCAVYDKEGEGDDRFDSSYMGSVREIFEDIVEIPKETKEKMIRERVFADTNNKGKLIAQLVSDDPSLEEEAKEVLDALFRRLQARNNGVEIVEPVEVKVKGRTREKRYMGAIERSKKRQKKDKKIKKINILVDN